MQFRRPSKYTQLVYAVFFSLLLLLLVQATSAQPVDEPSAYQFAGIKFALIYNGTALSPLENLTQSYISSKGAEEFQLFSPSTPISTLLTFDVILQAEPHLNFSQVNQIEDSNGSIILLYHGIESIDTSRWNNSMIVNETNKTNLLNQTYKLMADDGPTRGYPVNSSFEITEANAVRLNSSGNYTQNLIDLNDSTTVVASKQKGTGKTILIGFNLSSHHEFRILDKAIYWIEGKNPTVHQNSRYCLYECPWIGSPGCRRCADIVVVVENPSAVTPQESSSYYLIYTQQGDVVNKIEYSEFTLTNLSSVKLVVIPKENKISSSIPTLRSQNKSLLFVHRGVLEAEQEYFSGTTTGIVNKTNITNGDAEITQNRFHELTYGYPIHAHIYTQNESTRVLAEVPGYTTLARTSEGSLLSYVNESSKVIFYGFDPYAAQSTQCTQFGYHGGLLYLRSVQWSLGTFNISVDTPKDITLIVYNDNLLSFCANTLTPQEASVINRLTERYGLGKLTLLDLSYANATDYADTRLVISLSSERVTYLLDDWIASNKSIMLLHEGVVDVNASLFNGSSTPEFAYSGSALIKNNGYGSISYGYPANALIETQEHLNGSSNDSMRYLTSTPGFTTIASYSGKDVLSSHDAATRTVVYGFDPYMANISPCPGYHGWKLFDRSVDWLLRSLNITAPRAKKIAIQYYAASEALSCSTGQESKAYARLSTKPYAKDNISKVDLSLANITDYSDTELIIIGDSYRVSSLISIWKSNDKDLMFLLYGVSDAVNYFGGSASVDITNDTHVNITTQSTSPGAITEGYAPKAYVDADLPKERFTHTISGLKVLATNSKGESVLSSKADMYSGSVVYTLNLTENSDPCKGYHGWKLFDRSVEWLLGELSIPSVRVGRIGLVVNILYNNTNLCYLPEENKTFERVLSLRNVSAAGINATAVEISEISSADFTETEAVIVTDSNVDSIGSYYENLLNGDTHYHTPVGVLMFQTGMDRYRRLYNKTPCSSTMHYGSIYGRITTTNDQNRIGERPPYGYPYNAKVQVHGSETNSCYWSTLPTGFFGFLKNDTELITEWIGVASTEAYSEKFVLLGYRPYDGWVNGKGDSNNEYYHGSVIFDRAVVWLLGDQVQKNRTKDVVLMVYNKNSIIPQESVVSNWSNNSFGDARFSFLDISDVLYYDTCGASRFIAVKGDLVSGIVDHWSSQLRGVVFLGESLYDASKGLGAFPEGKIDPLDDEYSFAIYGTVINNSYTGLLNLPLNSSWKITENITAVYSVETIGNLNLNYTALVLHSNRSIVGGDEVIMAAGNTSNSTGIVLFGLNTELSTDVGRNWSLNSIEWSNPRDLTPPAVTNIVVLPSIYTPGNRISFDVDIADNRNWSVYSASINYTKNNVNWTTAELSRVIDPDSYTCQPRLNMNKWNASLSPFNETFIVYTITAVDTSGNRNTTQLKYYGVPDTEPPEVRNIGFKPYMPNSSDSVIIEYNTNEFSNSTLYYRVRGSGDPWTEIKNQEFMVFNHSVDTGTHAANTSYEYWIRLCDLSGNCGNATNGGQYYWFCIEGGCEKYAPNITNYTPSNGTIFPPNTTDTTMVLSTNEWAECRYSNTSDKSFDLMESTFNRTHNTTHIAYPAIYNTSYYYIRCKDMLGNKQNVSLMLYYWIDYQPPTVTLNSPENNSTNAGSFVSFRYTPQDNGILDRCSVYTNFNGWNIESTRSNISKGVQNSLSTRICDGSFTWNVKCWDSVNNSAFATANYTLNINSTTPLLLIAPGEGSGEGQLNLPEGIDVFGDSIYVADTYNHRFQKYNKSTGAYISGVGSYGVENYQLIYPEAIAAGYVTYNVTVNQSTNRSALVNVTKIYVADTQNFRVQVFYDINNTYAGNITNSDHIMGVAAVGERIFVSDTHNNQIKVYNASTLTSLISPFSGGGLNKPQGLTSDGSKIYVANTENSNVLIYNIYGTHLDTLGTYGSGVGQFISPEDVAVDSSGNIYIADTENSRIQIFNSTKGFLKSIGSYGFSETQFRKPKGIAVDNEDKLYVADTENSRIQVFSPCFVTTTTSTSTTTTTTTAPGTTTTTSTTSTTTSTTTTSIIRREVVLNEVMPHPNGAGDFDWVELYNRGNVEVNLTGWVVDDAEGGSQNYTIPSGIIPVAGFTLLNSSVTNINFDSTEDEARLFNSSGSLVDNLTWTEDAGVSTSWMRSRDGLGVWVKSSSNNPPSPGGPNVVTFTETIVTGWDLISLPLNL